MQDSTSKRGSANSGGYYQGTSSSFPNQTEHLFTDITPETALYSSDGESDLLCLSNMHCVVNEGAEDEFICHAYQRSYFFTSIEILLIIATGGFLWLIFYWRPEWELSFTHYKCSFSDNVNAVLLLPQDGTLRQFVEKVDKTSNKCLYLTPHIFNNNKADVMGSEYESPLVPRRSPSLDGDGNEQLIRFFHHYDEYIWSENNKTFMKVGGLDKNVSVEHIINLSQKGLTKEEQDELRIIYKDNVIEVQIPSYIRLLLLEVLNPFYVFQMFAVIFWMIDEYRIYATAIFIISTISAIVSLITVRQERVNLHNMVLYHNKNKVQILRRKNSTKQSTENDNNQFEEEEIWTEDLVPGDIVVIPPTGTLLSYDAALITGTCIVNESMLTGESIPVTKTPLVKEDEKPNEVFDVDNTKLHMLYCGTEVIQTRYYRNELVKAVVVRTGFQTSKGQLVHSILFPKPSNLNLFRDSYRFVAILFGIALIGFIYTVVYQANQGESIHDIMFNAIDLITITVPPALPLALTIGIVYAQQRLKKAKIHCISPGRINVAGQVDLVAFDKTGTLTEDSLDLTEILTTGTKEHDHASFLPSQSPEDFWTNASYDDDVLRCMATCHCLTIIKGNIVGDPLDVKMFEATKWKLVEPKVDDEEKFDQLQTTYVQPPKPKHQFDESVTLSSEVLENTSIPSPSHSKYSSFNYEVGIVRQFPFTSALQRSSVITRSLKSKNPNDMLIYVKGAPEKIQSLCHAETIPLDFKETLKCYTENGYRVIALAYKQMNLRWIKAQKIDRSLIENELNFLGLLVLQNKLKPNTCDVLRTLHSAQIRTVMVTGDNVLTALSVARECNIIKPNMPVLLAKTTPPSIDYNIIGDSSGNPPTLLWEEAQEVPNSVKHTKSTLKKNTEKANSIELTMDEIPSCQLVVSGHDYSIIKQYFPEYIESLSVQGAVFARMSPKHKTELMEDLQDVDYHVCMCGDGANDCGALKTAHVGLSLSEYEASVAAPFTASSECGVESMTTLIREGRAALVTSFGMFKFMALYSLIQFSTVTLLYTGLSNLSDLMYLYIDLIIIDLVAITMSRNHAYYSLFWKKPATNLVSPEVLSSIVFEILLQLGFQIIAVFFVQEQCWFIPHPMTELMNSNGTMPNATNCPAVLNIANQSALAGTDPDSYVTTTLFYLSSFMYLSVGVAFSRGHPFRTRIYKNRWFLFCLLFLTAFTLILMFVVPISWNDFFELVEIPDSKFLIMVCCIAIGHFVVCVSFEMFVIENFTFWKSVKSLCRCVYVNVKAHKTIADILSNNGETFNYKEFNNIAIPWKNKGVILTPNLSCHENKEVLKTKM